MINVLMIEDDRELAEILSEFLAKFSIVVTNYETPELGLSALRIKKFDIIILDLSLPDMDGVEVCRIITQKYKIPIIISSARSDIADKIATLNMGADDYLPKPYDPRELEVRIRSVLRRYQKEDLILEAEKVEKDFVINEDAMEILYKHQEIKLTKAEYGILKIFIQKNKVVISRSEISNSVDAINYESSEKSIDVIISRLRGKLEKIAGKNFIESVRGVGYKFVE